MILNLKSHDFELEGSRQTDMKDSLVISIDDFFEYFEVFTLAITQENLYPSNGL